MCKILADTRSSFYIKNVQKDHEIIDYYFNKLPSLLPDYISSNKGPWCIAFQQPPVSACLSHEEPQTTMKLHHTLVSTAPTCDADLMFTLRTMLHLTQLQFVPTQTERSSCWNPLGCFVISLKCFKCAQCLSMQQFKRTPLICHLHWMCVMIPLYLIFL